VLPNLGEIGQRRITIVQLVDHLLALEFEAGEAFAQQRHLWVKVIAFRSLIKARLWLL